MTQEEKARAYDEALKDMRVIYPNLSGDAKLAVEHAFPELAESEDERMRKKTINCLVMHNKGCIDAKDIDEYIDWLEKQKEQKPEVKDPFDDEQFRRGYEAGKHDAMRKQKPAEWSEEDKAWLSEVYFAIDHSMYSNDERQAMKRYIDSLRARKHQPK